MIDNMIALLQIRLRPATMEHILDSPSYLKAPIERVFPCTNLLKEIVGIASYSFWTVIYVRCVVVVDMKWI